MNKVIKILFKNKVLYLQHWAKIGKKERKSAYEKYHISIKQP